MIGNIKVESEPIGSIPRPSSLIKEINDFRNGKVELQTLNKDINLAIKETIGEFIKTNQSCICDGEQSKISFIGYPIFGSNQFNGDGSVYFDRKDERKSVDPNVAVSIDFLDGHSRHIPKLNGKNLPFRYARYASDFVKEALPNCGGVPYKQAIISPSALMLVYPSDPIEGYSRDQFIGDLLNECEKDIRQCFEAGASFVQIDATELRLSLKLDPSGSLFNAMIGLIATLLSRFSEAELQKIGIHECRGGDFGSPHSETVDITKDLLPGLFSLQLGRVFIEYAQENNREKILQVVSSHIKPNQKVFFGVTRIDRNVESVDEIKKLGLEIANHISPNQFGLCDTCGFSPFFDGEAVPRDVAFKKMLNRSEAAKLLENKFNNQN
ncbi:hypothetical protein DICPUDRAFT_92524 [Dictyostelium purpureum]|uniref:Cobalamin-independent methionine synthase MetE C-terminal/archaeal domain-containing protein n=1 Tax=Dictyostelium purpureum TaxID=5786 RepID=F0ZTB0_DICPU|nr:uncharacterized protein DICPUDRAFT_92524 [Dictyostelium purpureum]EGC32825.1 hypothetical protein DICPUDRAFT_92524 [Dictyostelium purpureum]|eukprot:XP_003290648.1 hypothetical protein DICPUDRAFT_92524 [Dictyostelium purpureum]